MIDLLRKYIQKIANRFGYTIINNNQRIVELSDKQRHLINITNPISMTPQIRRYNLIQALEYIAHYKLEGDLVECGVWKGGNLVIYKKFIEEKNIKKNIYAFDTFEGMSGQDHNDYIINGRIKAQTILDKDIKKITNDWGVCSLEEVKFNISQRTKNLNNIFFIKGKVEDTLLDAMNLPKKISILRLDTDFYQSTKIELEILYKKVCKGGVIIIDDYGHWAGSKKAVDEFFKEKFVWMHYVDYACRLIIKK
jgi:hypothetical protein